MGGALLAHAPTAIVAAQPLLKVLPVMVFFSTERRSGIARFSTYDESTANEGRPRKAPSTFKGGGHHLKPIR